jgi:hypothetical protein
MPQHTSAALFCHNKACVTGKQHWKIDMLPVCLPRFHVCRSATSLAARAYVITRQAAHCQSPFKEEMAADQHEAGIRQGHAAAGHTQHQIWCLDCHVALIPLVS